MRLAVVFPWSPGAISEAEDQHRTSKVMSRVAPGTLVEFFRIDEGSMFAMPFSLANTAHVVEHTIQAIERAAATAPDAIMVWGGIDPGLAEARERVDVPVIGTAQSTYAVAAQLGRPIGILVYEESIIEPINALAAKYGLTRLITKIRSIDVPHDRLIVDRPLVRERILERSRRLLEDDGSEIVYPQGMSMMPSSMEAAELSAAIGAPVLDPLLITIRTAELIGGLGLQSGRRAAPSAYRGSVTPHGARSGA